jgi:alanyl-tRNA synthetase
LITSAAAVDGVRVIARELEVADANELRAIGDRLRERLGSGAAVLAGRSPDRVALVAVVTDDMISRGVRADVLVREIAGRTGGTGGGRPHMAQGGVGDATQLEDALRATVDIVTGMLGVNT